MSIDERMCDYQAQLFRRYVEEMRREDLEDVAVSVAMVLQSLEIPFENAAGELEFERAMFKLFNSVNNRQASVEAEAAKIFGEWLTYTVTSWQEKDEKAFNPWAEHAISNRNTWRGGRNE